MNSSADSSDAEVVERRVLVVDDDRSVREPLTRFLKARGFDVEAADTADAALACLRGRQFATMICDVRMPGVSGIQLVPEALKLDPDLAVLMLTGLNDAGAATDALRVGAMDYLLKPLELHKLEDAINAAIRQRSERAEVRSLQIAHGDGRAPSLERQIEELHLASLASLEAVVTELEAKSSFRAGHASRVADLATGVARALELDAPTIHAVRIAARLHDIGNVVVPERILLKPDTLTVSEHAVVRKHVHAGLKLISGLPSLEHALSFISDHHERWAGGGYPLDLKGAAISIGGRILAAADAYTAVTAGREYSAALTSAAALARLARHSGTHFDPAVFQVMQEVVRGRHS